MSEPSKSGRLSSLFSSAAEKLSAQLPAVNQIQHTLRQQVATYRPDQASETLKLQLAIKAGGGVVMDEQALAREAKVYSKHLYLWGKDEKGADLVDVTDRLGFLVFKTAELQEAHALRLEQSRQALKDIRNFENELVPKRQKRQSLAAKLEAFQKAHPSPDKGASGIISKMSADLQQLEREDSTFESSLEVLKRTKLHEAFTLHFAAQRELGEKLAVVGGYGELLLQGMETGGVGEQYDGQEKAAKIRAEVVETLNAWSKPLIPTPELKLDGSSFLGRSETQSFGSTHASELSQLEGGSDSASLHPPSPTVPTLTKPTYEPYHRHPPLPPTSIPIPEVASQLNLAPIAPPPLPARSPSSPSSSSFQGRRYSLHDSPPSVASPLVSSAPTVAETGIPIVGSGGPSSGQLPHATPPSATPIHLASLGGSTSSKASEAASESANTSNASGISRMATTSRRRLERAELDLGGEEGLPAYGEMEEEQTEEERAASEAEVILARERERKSAGGSFRA